LQLGPFWNECAAASEGGVPRISEFFGILIYMYFGDHDPPHFHALYGEHEAVIHIISGKVLEGHLPRKQLNAVLEWRSQHEMKLFLNWTLCRDNTQPIRIPPLE
jgi:hypothetical protein